MRHRNLALYLIPLLAVGTLNRCSTSSAKSPEVSDSIRTSLAEAGLKNVSVKQDRRKAVVTLTGQVPSNTAKSEAESIARSAAAGEIVGNEIEVVPSGAKSGATAANSDLDRDIENNLDVALIRHQLHQNVKYDVKSGVVTLKGDVESESKRTYAQSIAARVPNVLLVVNELQVKNQMANSTK